jgi:hypothetical protein
MLQFEACKIVAAYPLARNPEALTRRGQRGPHAVARALREIRSRPLQRPDAAMDQPGRKREPHLIRPTPDSPPRRDQCRIVADCAEPAALHFDHFHCGSGIARVGGATAILQQPAPEVAVVGLAHGDADADLDRYVPGSVFMPKRACGYAICCSGCCPEEIPTRHLIWKKPRHIEIVGSGGRIRTYDQSVNSRLLYR